MSSSANNSALPAPKSPLPDRPAAPAGSLPFALLDTPSGGALLFTGLLQTRVLNADSWAQTLTEVGVLADQGAFPVLALDYELGQYFEPAAAQPLASPEPRSGSGWVWVFARRDGLDAAALAAWLDEQAGDPPRPALVADLQPMPWPDAAAMTAVTAGAEATPAAEAAHRHAYLAAVERIRAYIAAGDCYQVNLTFMLQGQLLGDPLALYARLRAAQPVAHGGVIVTAECCRLSLSPELFISRQGGQLTARPMKGTAPRQPTPAADAAEALALAASPKNRAENVMIVDLLRNDLGRIAAPGSVQVRDLCAVETYPTLLQMTSTITASSNSPLPEVLAAVFPCGSITGAPKVRAMQIAATLEGRPRGFYTGAIGWVGAGGDFSFNVAIRTLDINAAGQVHYGVGSGIVWDSDPVAEYQECWLKARVLRMADPGFALIETLRLQAGNFPDRAGHLARLQRSARVLGFADSAVPARLDAIAREHPEGGWRVRLALCRDGRIDTAVLPLTPEPWRRHLQLAGARLCPDDPWLAYKTTVRPQFDAVLARLYADPACADCFDEVFLNTRGEVCEGARSTIFIQPAGGGPLLTPALACGLLPGVLRQQLLDSGAAVEARLCLDDLRHASARQGLFAGNALRGLQAVCWRDEAQAG